VRSLFENYMVQVKIATLQQKQGFSSTLPLGQDELRITTQMNTAPLSTTFPFVSADLSSDKGVLYGINRHNNSLILFDRFSLENANVVVFGKSGGGKSYLAKLEILRSLMFGADVIAIDPENEYQYLAETVGGTFFRISLTSEHHLNPFDLPPPLTDEDPAQVLRQNIIDLVGIFKVMLGGVTPKEDALLDEAVTETYAARDITISTPEYWQKTPPRLQDLQEVLESIEGAEEMAAKFQKYTRGRFAGFFNQQSNVDINNFFVVFNIRDMEEQLRPTAMYIILNYIWKRIRRQLKKRLLFIDEAWWLMRHAESGEFLLSIAKRARKYYLGLTTITQDLNDFLKSPYGEPIITNSSLQILFKQSPATIDLVQHAFQLTEEEKLLLLQSTVGQGIFFAGLKHAAMEVVASYSEDQIITSDPEQLLKIEAAKKELAQAETAVAVSAESRK
jgi:type IV secretory pathway VirB4 component